MIAAALCCFLVTPAWPLPLACLLFFVFGSTASGWNGAFMAEVARLVPSKLVSRTTAGALFYVNVGKMIGPLVVAGAYAWSGRYAVAFGCLAVITVAALACLLTVRARRGAGVEHEVRLQARAPALQKPNGEHET